MVMNPHGGIFETTRLAMQVTNFDIVHFCQKDLIHRFNQINDHGVLLHDINDANIFFLV